MLRRFFKTASVTFFIACVTLVAFWVRSYHGADRIHGRLRHQRSFLIASKQGRLTMLGFRLQGAPNWWRAGIHTFEADDEMSFPVGSVRQHEAALGFGTLRDPIYMVMRSTFETPEGATILISGAAVTTLRGYGFIIPYWSLVLLCAVLGVALRLERPLRYTTRGLLMAITFVAILLGLIAGLDQGPDPWQLDIPAPLDEL